MNLVSLCDLYTALKAVPETFWVIEAQLKVYIPLR